MCLSDLDGNYSEKARSFIIDFESLFLKQLLWLPEAVAAERSKAFDNRLGHLRGKILNRY